MYNKQQYKNVRHQATRRAQIWLIQWRHSDAIEVLFITVANESFINLSFTPTEIMFIGVVALFVFIIFVC